MKGLWSLTAAAKSYLEAEERTHVLEASERRNLPNSLNVLKAICRFHSIPASEGHC